MQDNNAIKNFTCKYWQWKSLAMESFWHKGVLWQARVAERVQGGGRAICILIPRGELNTGGHLTPLQAEGGRDSHHNLPTSSKILPKSFYCKENNLKQWIKKTLFLP